MTTANRSPFPEVRAGDLNLLRECVSLGATPLVRPSAVERLEAAIGRELTRRLLTSLIRRS
jgi:hypothetical protein